MSETKTNVTDLPVVAPEAAQETEETVAITFNKKKIKRVAVRVAAATAAVAAVVTAINFHKKADSNETLVAEPLEDYEWKPVDETSAVEA